MARNNKEKLNKIYDVFDKWKVDISRDSLWEVQGTPVVYHKDVERLGAAMKITWDKPDVLRAEKDEAVILVTGRMGERAEWSIGEALVGVNYRVSGKQAAYVYAMAEKRAKDRVILKMADLHGDVYSEEEADEFKESARGRSRSSDDEGVQRTVSRGESESDPEPRRDDNVVDMKGKAGNDNPSDAEKELKEKITKAKTINAVTDLMLHSDTQRILNDLPEAVRDSIRDFAKARLTELGWPTKKAAG